MLYSKRIFLLLILIFITSKNCVYNQLTNGTTDQSNNETTSHTLISSTVIDVNQTNKTNSTFNSTLSSTISTFSETNSVFNKTNTIFNATNTVFNETETTTQQNLTTITSPKQSKK